MEEGNMFPSTRFIVKRNPFQGMVPVLMVIALTLFPVLASADEDPCREAGIYIGNQTMIDVWHKRDGGPCTRWVYRHILIMKPEETLILYRDMTCETEYCAKNPTYEDYKSLDADQNCRVRIVPNCTLLDM
jgi:hypothetical protein